MHNVPKWSVNAARFLSVSDHFGTLCIKGLMHYKTIFRKNREGINLNLKEIFFLKLSKDLLASICVNILL